MSDLTPKQHLKLVTLIRRLREHGLALQTLKLGETGGLCFAAAKAIERFMPPDSTP